MQSDVLKFSVVVPTLGRKNALLRLLESLERQSFQNFEVIIVDQNPEDRLSNILLRRKWRFGLKHIRTPAQKGLSRGRNVGWRIGQGQLFVFSDDDCWYPPSLLSQVDTLFRTTGADLIGGRATDETGRSINGRYETTAQKINRKNVWTTSIEWMLFFRRDVLEVLDGFDETIGLGASTPWQSAEGQDIVLRALAAGFHCYFDPAVHGYHPELDIVNPDEAMVRKGRAYARGMGFVLRRHGYGLADLVAWIGRPSVAALLYAMRGQRSRVLYYLNVALGRLEGWRQSV